MGLPCPPDPEYINPVELMSTSQYQYLRMITFTLISLNSHWISDILNILICFYRMTSLLSSIFLKWSSIVWKSTHSFQTLTQLSSTQLYHNAWQTHSRELNFSWQGFPSSCLIWTRTLPLNWTSLFHSRGCILFWRRPHITYLITHDPQHFLFAKEKGLSLLLTSTKTFNPAAVRTSFISAHVGFSTA